MAGTIDASLDRGGTIQDAYSSLLVPEVARTLTRGAESAGKGGYAGRRQEDDDNIIAFDTTQITSGENRSNPQPGDPCHPIPAHGHAPAVAFNARQDPDVFDGFTGPLDTDGSSHAVHQGWRVRRLMPIECERLQGFPDGYTNIPWRGKTAAPDGPRYKALGNSMAVNVMRWIGQRIQTAEDVTMTQDRVIKGDGCTS